MDNINVFKEETTKHSENRKIGISSIVLIYFPCPNVGNYVAPRMLSYFI